MSKNFWRLFFVLVTILGAVYTGRSQSAFSSKVIGVGIVVSNLEKSLNFCMKGIGMVRTGGFDLEKDFTLRSGLSNGVPFSVTVLKLEDSPDANE